MMAHLLDESAPAPLEEDVREQQDRTAQVTADMRARWVDRAVQGGARGAGIGDWGMLAATGELGVFEAERGGRPP